MLLMYVGTATSSTNGAIVSSTTNDIDVTLPEDIHSSSMHNDSTTNVIDKPTNNHTYACSQMKLK